MVRKTKTCARKIKELRKKIKKFQAKEGYSSIEDAYAELKGDKDASINDPGFKEAESILKKLNVTLRKHLLGGKEKFDPETSSLFPVRWTIITSMASLGYTLGEHISRGFQIEPWRDNFMSQWPTPQYLVDLMVEKGFCRMDAGRLENHPYTRLEVVYYIAVAMETQKSSTRSILRHDKCTVNRCKAGNISEEDYLFKHGAACDGKCDFVGVDVGRVISVIKEGKIPVVQLVEENGKSHLEVSSVDTKKDIYVALSHV